MYDLEHPPGDIFVHFSDDAALSLKSLAALARTPYNFHDPGTMDLLWADTNSGITPLQ
jgi:hypothetical protein